MDIYNHSFVEENNFKNHGRDLVNCLKCLKCNIIFAKVAGHPAFDYFYLNDKEIYPNILNQKMLNLSCEEIIIKNILE